VEKGHWVWVTTYLTDRVSTFFAPTKASVVASAAVAVAGCSCRPAKREKKEKGYFVITIVLSIVHLNRISILLRSICLAVSKRETEKKKQGEKPTYKTKYIQHTMQIPLRFILLIKFYWKQIEIQQERREQQYEWKFNLSDLLCGFVCSVFGFGCC
jgi:hypothetical protein